MTVGTAGALRAVRPPKPRHDPWRAQGFSIEPEPWLEKPTTEGRAELAPPHPPTVRDALTVYLTGAECPFTCVFCDLWQYTLDGATPPSALPTQLEAVLADLGPTRRGASVLKLYNASNFFDPRAVPPADLDALAALASPFDQVVVESHARFLGPACRRFAERCEANLQVAMGVETAHPEAHARLGKGTDLDTLRRAAERLAQWDVGLRVFLLVHPPFVPLSEGLDWIEHSVAFARELGAQAVSLIPLRGTEATLARLAQDGTWRPPTLDDLEAALERAWPVLPGRVSVDPWDLEALAANAPDGAPGDPRTARRIARLRAIAETGRWRDAE